MDDPIEAQNGLSLRARVEHSLPMSEITDGAVDVHDAVMQTVGESYNSNLVSPYFSVG